jgi:hypothetical protein
MFENKFSFFLTEDLSVHSNLSILLLILLF